MDYLLKSQSFLCLNLPKSPIFDCNESNSENVTFELCELKTALFDRETEEDRLTTVGIEFCESECFVVIVDEEYQKKDEKHITLPLKLVGKEITDFGNKKLSMSSFLSNNFFISSNILLLTHESVAGTVTGSLKTFRPEFTGSKRS